MALFCPLNITLTNSLLTLLQQAITPSQIFQIHAKLVTSNLINDSFTASRLLASIAINTSDLNYAELVFSQIRQVNTFICNLMLRIHVRNSNPQRAFSIYDSNMRKIGVLCDNYTYPSVLKACGMMVGLWEGREVHGELLKRGFDFDLFVGNGLMSLYCECGEIGDAQKVFGEMPVQDVVSWSIMIDGYGKKCGNILHARELFDSMPSRDLISWNSMMDLYVKIGEIMSARQLFEEMPTKDIKSWSILVDGYARHGNPIESLKLFHEMLQKGIRPDKVSMASVISACSQLGAIDQGRWVHAYINKKKIEIDIVVQTSLMDMYVKCGSLDEAKSIFDSMTVKNVVSYSVIIGGLGMNGLGKEALEIFAQMEVEGIVADELIFLAVLTACSHGGFVKEGLQIFNRMRRDSRIEPKLEHYGCLIDLFGRAGRLNDAEKVIETMPMKANSALWGSLLLACKIHQNLTMAENVLKRLVEIKGDDCGVYVLVSNIYGDLGMWEGVARMRKVMREKKMKKESGRSVIEVNGSIEEFVSGEKPRVRHEEIVFVILSLLKVKKQGESS